jgi:hypothetical protein
LEGILSLATSGQCASSKRTYSGRIVGNADISIRFHKQLVNSQRQKQRQKEKAKTKAKQMRGVFAALRKTGEW